MNAVEIDNLTYTYPGASQPTLNDISLQIAQGDFLGSRWKQRLWEVHFVQGSERTDPSLYHRDIPRSRSGRGTEHPGK